MIDFSVKKVDELQSGLLFQIGHIKKDNQISYEDSIIVSEKAFCLIEFEFMSEFTIDEYQYINYHWEHTCHNKQGTQRIIERLKNLKLALAEDTKPIVSKTFRNDIVAIINYLSENQELLFLFIDEIINFLEKSLVNGNQGVHVYGI